MSRTRLLSTPPPPYIQHRSHPRDPYLIFFHGHFPLFLGASKHPTPFLSAGPFHLPHCLYSVLLRLPLPFHLRPRTPPPTHIIRTTSTRVFFPCFLSRLAISFSSLYSNSRPPVTTLSRTHLFRVLFPFGCLFVVALYVDGIPFVLF